MHVGALRALEKNRCQEPLCKAVSRRMGVSFSISWRGILFPLEMEADRKAISVSGFTVLSPEPAKSKHQMAVREHSGFFPPLPVPTSCQKDPKYHSWENRVCLESQSRRPVLWRQRILPRKLGGRGGEEPQEAAFPGLPDHSWHQDPSGH